MKAQKAAVRSRRRGAAPSDEAAREAALTGEPPAWLKKEGLAIWHRLAPTLRDAKLLTVVDVLTFARYCRNFADWLKARRKLDADGMTYEAETYVGAATENGEQRPARVTKLRRLDPLFTAADRLERQLLAAEDRFGLNPVERQRIFAARAQTGVTGDLFAPARERRDGDPATPAAEAAQPIATPIGFLN